MLWFSLEGNISQANAAHKVNQGTTAHPLFQMTAVLFLFMTYKMVNVYLEKMNHGTKSDDCSKLSRTEQVLKYLSLESGNFFFQW